MGALATKYRPRIFEDVIGQDHVMEILKKQIVEGKVKQGYLFTGGPGTGKTTTARIIASAINQGRGGVIEIDAASNNGVENIRNIIENCKFKSMETDYKIYIIDEAHMLSTGAFNAFLKVLEEPPAHVIFILCTTDPQKIIPTIMSRLQRFDFKRVSIDNLVGRLEFIAKSESLKVSSDAFAYIAKLANGGVRDAISILDTLAGYKDILELSDVESILNRVGIPTYIDFLTFLQEGSTKEALEALKEMFMDGINLKVFVKDFTAFVIECTIYFMTDDAELTSFPDVYLDDISELDDIDPDLFTRLSDLSNTIKYESNFRYIVEGWVIQECMKSNS